MFGIGAFEMLILLGIALVLLAGIATAAVFALWVIARHTKPGSTGGEVAGEDMVACADCSQMVPVSAESCPNCGRPLHGLGRHSGNWENREPRDPLA